MPIFSSSNEIKEMKKIYILAIAAILLHTTSCKKYLDTKPSDFYSTINYYQTAEQLQSALNAVYSNMISPELFGQVQHFNFMSTTDEMLPSVSVALDNRGFYYGNLTASHYYVGLAWQYPYLGINLANNLIDNIERPSMDEKARGYIKGQALFLRAYNYFLLTTNFGEVPLILHSPSATEYNIAESSQTAIYEQIVADLKEAEQLLNGRTVASLNYNDVVTETAVQAMLAKVYLYWASYPLNDVSKYDEALTYANKVINSGLHELNPDYKQVFINLFQDKYDVKENILEWGSYGAAAGVTNKTGNDIGNFIGITSAYNASYPNLSFTAAAWIWTTRKLFDSYETIPASQLTFKASLDTRRDWNCADFSYTYATVGGIETRVATPVTNLWQLRCGKFRREYAPKTQRALGTYGTNWPVIRIADVFLIRAEAAILKSSPDLDMAKADIERVRKRAYGTMYGNIVKDITVTNGGSGYSSANLPTVTITGGGGSGATATAIVSSAGVVTGIRLTSRGTLTAAGPYYTSIPVVSISAPVSGVRATAVASITNGNEHFLSTTLTQTDLFNVLKAERMRELCFEASRKYDLVRWGRFYQDMQDFRAYAVANGGGNNGNGLNALSGVDEKHKLLPKPIYEINLNKALKQNPGY
jgi:hypothetical protein